MFECSDLFCSLVRSVDVVRTQIQMLWCWMEGTERLNLPVNDCQDHVAAVEVEATGHGVIRVDSEQSLIKFARQGDV